MRKVIPVFILAILLLTTLACGSEANPTVVENAAEGGNEAAEVTDEDVEVVDEEAEPSDKPESTEGPTNTPAPTNTPEPTDVPEVASVEIVQSNDFTDYGTLNIIGAVENTGNVNLEYVKIVGVLRDAEGGMILSEYTYADSDIITPGAISPFTLYFLDPPTDWVEYELTVQYSETSDQPYTDLELEVANAAAGDYGIYQIAGEIRNTGNRPVEFIKIIAMLYDAEDTLIANDFTYTDLDVIQPDSSSPFTIQIMGVGAGISAVDHYELLVQARPSD